MDSDIIERWKASA